MFVEFLFLIGLTLLCCAFVLFFTSRGRLQRCQTELDSLKLDVATALEDRDAMQTARDIAIEKLRDSINNANSLEKQNMTLTAEIVKLRAVIKDYHKADRRKLTDEQVAALRCVLNSDIPITGGSLAIHLDVNPSTISEARNYKTYKEVAAMDDVDEAIKVLNLPWKH